MEQALWKEDILVLDRRSMKDVTSKVIMHNDKLSKGRPAFQRLGSL